MPGMRCDGPDCNDYLLYREVIVAVRIDGARLLASVELEDTPPRERPAPIGRYHPACYGVAREVDGRLPAPSD